MSNTDDKKPKWDLGNAIENETREAESNDEESFGYDDEGRPVKSPKAAPEVTEEDSRLAEEYPDGGGETAGKKY